MKPHVPVVDEVGYLACGDDAANVLYHVVNDRNIRRRAMIFTVPRSGRSTFPNTSSTWTIKTFLEAAEFPENRQQNSRNAQLVSIASAETSRQSNASLARQPSSPVRSRQWPIRR